MKQYQKYFLAGTLAIFSQIASAAHFKGNVGVTLQQMGVPVSATIPLQGEIVHDGTTIKSIVMQASTAGLKIASAEAKDAGLGPLWLSANKYPLAAFKSTEIKPLTSMGDYTIKGFLTIKNKTKPVEFKARIIPKEASALLTINRLDYDLGLEMWKDISVISNKVQLNMKGQYE